MPGSVDGYGPALALGLIAAPLFTARARELLLNRDDTVEGHKLIDEDTTPDEETEPSDS